MSGFSYFFFNKCTLIAIYCSKNVFKSLISLLSFQKKKQLVQMHVDFFLFAYIKFALCLRIFLTPVKLEIL